MDSIFDVDWRGMFVPTLALLEIVVRGTLVYLALFVLLRFVLRRETGSVGIADLLLIVLLADAAQNALGIDYRSITEGILLVGTLVFWNYMLDYLAYRTPVWRKILKPPPLLLVRNGKILYDHWLK